MGAFAFRECKARASAIRVPIFDSHCHPQFAAYDNDREEMIRRNISEGVFMIAVGTSYETSRAAVLLAKKYPGKIWATVGIHPVSSPPSRLGRDGGSRSGRLTTNGIHPHHATESPHDPMETKREIRNEKIENRIIELAKAPEVVAIGETGLDYHYIKPGDDAERAKNAQRALFLDQIELARKIKKPLVVHARNAYRDVLEILCVAQFQYGVIAHFFQGGPAEAQQFLDLGAYISFAGPVTFIDQYDETIKSVPLERVLIETDAPYASPAPYRGQRNEPRFVRFVAEKIAEIKNIDPEEVIRITAENTKNVFMI